MAQPSDVIITCPYPTVRCWVKTAWWSCATVARALPSKPVKNTQL